MTQDKIAQKPTLIGASIPRYEDRTLVMGQGRFLDDIVVEGGFHGAFLRSQYAHARITAIDIQEASQMPGVVAVYTARTLAPALPGGNHLATGLPSSSIAFPLDRPILAEAEDAVDAI
jgi:carbon-monoxide dehydrogenase large subunit